MDYVVLTKQEKGKKKTDEIVALAIVLRILWFVTLLIKCSILDLQFRTCTVLSAFVVILL